MDRRNFLVNGTMAVFALSIFGKTVRAADGTFSGDCDTSNDILGPFYRAKAPMRADLTYDGLQGTRLLIKGKVHTDDCVTPLHKAVVEIWHCDSSGEYDNTTKEFRHRARWETNEKGEYSFLTILPGKYLNGELYRPSHVHFRVTAPGHKELISQLYFKGDPHIPEDPWASSAKAVNRILPIIPESTKGELAVLFDIYLDKS